MVYQKPSNRNVILYTITIQHIDIPAVFVTASIFESFSKTSVFVADLHKIREMNIYGGFVGNIN
jgi:hypothetical protein